MRPSRATMGFALFAVVSVALTWTIWSTLQRAVPGDTTRYSAVFSDVLGLRVGDDIRMAGVRVGRVDSIDFDDRYQARVEFQVQNNQRVTTETVAMVRYQNLIGQRYVALGRGEGAGRPLAPGGEIPIERTEPSFDVSALLAGFEPLFAVLQPDQVNSLSETLVQALQGDGVSLSALITQAAGLARTFGDRDQILGEVIANLSGVVSGLAGRSAELETLLTQSRALISGLYDQGEVLKVSVDQVARSTDSLVSMLAGVKPALTQVQFDTTAGLGVLLGQGTELDQAAMELPEILNAVARFSGNGAYANAYICSLDVSLWDVIFPRGLFSQVGGNAHSEVCR